MKTPFLFLLIGAPITRAFCLAHTSKVSCGQKKISDTVLFKSKDEENSTMRRNVIGGVTYSVASLFFGSSASAIPMVSVDEFSILLRDSSLSVQLVEFSGP